MDDVVVKNSLINLSFYTFKKDEKDFIFKKKRWLHEKSMKITWTWWGKCWKENGKSFQMKRVCFHKSIDLKSIYISTCSWMKIEWFRIFFYDSISIILLRLFHTYLSFSYLWVSSREYQQTWTWRNLRKKKSSSRTLFLWLRDSIQFLRILTFCVCCCFCMTFCNNSHIIFI